MKHIMNSDALAVIVRQRRLELGLSQALLATKVGVSRQWVIDIEKGKPRAEVVLVFSLLQELGLELQVKVADITQAQEGCPKTDTKQGEAKIRALAEAFDFL